MYVLVPPVSRRSGRITDSTTTLPASYVMFLRSTVIISGMRSPSQTTPRARLPDMVPASNIII